MSSETLTHRLTQLEQRVDSHLHWTSSKIADVENSQRLAAVRIDELDAELFGKSGFGLVTRVKILWAAHHWFLALAGVVLGGSLTAVLIHWLE